MTTRRDSLRNREALLAAAREVFEAEGIDAPLENIAAAAGLSRTSLFRHFATRGDLVAAIWASDVAQTEADVARFAGQSDAFVRVFDLTLRQQIDRRSIHPTAAQIEGPDIVALAARFVAAIETSVARSREAGVLRADVSDAEGLRAVGMGIWAIWNVADRREREAVADEVRRLLLRGLLDPQWAAQHPEVIGIG
jgi:AcrR family transcriptional regulator